VNGEVIDNIVPSPDVGQNASTAEAASLTVNNESTSKELNEDPKFTATPPPASSLPMNVDAPAEAASPTVNNNSTSKEPNQDPKSTATPPPASSLTMNVDAPPPTAEAASPSVNNDSTSNQDPKSTATPPPASSLTMNVDAPPSTAEAASPTVNNDSTSNQDPKSTATPPPASSLAMNVDAQPSTTERTSSPDAMDVDQEKGKEDELTLSTNVAAPAWLTALNMDIYFRECSDVKAWQELVQSLYKFEERNTINGVCHYNCSTNFFTNSLPVEFTDNFTSRTGRKLDQKQEKKFPA
jgi:hypothetical protein